MFQNVAEKTHTSGPDVQATLPQRQLTDALKTVELSAPTRSRIEAQRGVMLTSERDRLTLSTFDFDTCVSTTVPAGPALRGRSLLDFAQVKHSVAALSAGETKRVADATSISLGADMLSTPDVAVPVAAYDAEDYVSPPSAVPAVATVDAQDFFAQLERVLPCAGRDDSLPVLTAVKMRLDGKSLTMSATDRYRLSIAKLKASATVSPISKRFSVLLPGSVLRSLAKRMKNAQGLVGLGLSATGEWSTLSFGATQVTMRRIEGDLPKLEALLPKSPDAAIEVNRVALYRAAKKAEALQRARGERNGPLHCALGASLTLTPFIGEGQDRVKGLTVAATYRRGRPGQWQGKCLGINPRFLLEALSTFTGDTVTIHFIRPEGSSVAKPMLFTDGAAPSGDAYQHLLMPVRLS